MPKIPKRNKTAPQQQNNPVLARIQKRIAVQAALALTAIALAVIMIFAMTAAWYTNIVHTSGLVFEVESWGFNGDIVSNMLPIIAGPGDEGLINLEVDSDSDSASAVSVSFSKAEMPRMMQQRIFFYADTQVVRNNEVMDRVYLNSQESYTYNLFSQGKLTLTESVHNAPQLKWHWVYDVLGYYVEGIRLADGQDVEPVEYLRPIEYDYDAATMHYDAVNNVYIMETVDGTMTMDEYLVKISETDGYPGTIDPEKKLLSGYYPVDVDEETGNGVYAYLCSYAQIQTNTYQDTALGQGDYTNAMPPYTAKLMISAQKSKNTVVSVNSLSGLNSAIELGVADTIKLSGDVTIGADEVLAVKAGQRVMIDLDGNSLVCTTPNQIPIVVEERGSLTVVNGSIAYDSTDNSKNCAVHVTGGEVVMSNVTLTGFEQGMKITDNTAEQSTDSTVRLVGCQWSTNSTTLLVHGNGRDTVQKTQVIIEDSRLTSNKITLSGNGTTDSATTGGNYGTDIQIINSEIISNKTGLDGKTSVYSAIYQPQKDSVLTIYNSTISGYTGIAIKGGEVNIIGSTVAGWGDGMETVEKFANSGFNDTGDAVYIETNYNYPIALNISDLVTGAGENARTVKTVLTSSSRYALRVFDPKADCVEVNIVSGSFSTGGENIKAVPNEAQFLSYLDPDSELQENNGSYFVNPKPIQLPEQNGGTD